MCLTVTLTWLDGLYGLRCPAETRVPRTVTARTRYHDTYVFDLLLLATAEKSQGSCAFGDYVRDAYSKLSLIIPAPAAGEVVKR